MMISALAIVTLCLGVFLVLYTIYKIYQKKRVFNTLFSPTESLLEEIQREHHEKLETLLQIAGIQLKEYRLLQLLSLITGIVIFSLIFIFDIPLVYQLLITLLALAIAFGAPPLFLIEQKNKRIETIDRDLAIFLDLLVIILQSGGGLLNAIETVTKEAKDIICPDLLEESKKFQSEITTLPSNVAYENLIKRTGSENVASVVSYMKISEESGIGLKTIFENQAQAIKERQFFEVEKKAASINLKMILVVFFFILPAVGAFIILPMSDEALMPQSHVLLKNSH